MPRAHAARARSGSTGTWPSTRQAKESMSMRGRHARWQYTIWSKRGYAVCHYSAVPQPRRGDGPRPAHGTWPAGAPHTAHRTPPPNPPPPSQTGPSCPPRCPTVLQALGRPDGRTPNTKRPHPAPTQPTLQHRWSLKGPPRPPIPLRKHKHHAGRQGRQAGPLPSLPCASCRLPCAARTRLQPQLGVAPGAAERRAAGWHPGGRAAAWALGAAPAAASQRAASRAARAPPSPRAGRQRLGQCCPAAAGLAHTILLAAAPR